MDSANLAATASHTTGTLRQLSAELSKREAAAAAAAAEAVSGEKDTDQARALRAFEQQDRFVPVMTKFNEQASGALQVLLDRHATLLAKAEQLIKYYGETPKDTTPEHFFALLSGFSASFAKTAQDLAKKAEKDAKEKKKLKDKAGKNKDTAALEPSPSSKPAKSKQGKDSGRLVDEVLGSLKVLLPYPTYYAYSFIFVPR